MHYLAVDAIAFTVLGYPMSWVELVGTALYLLSVWLIAQRRMATWPVGIVSSLLYAWLFYQIHLYSDAIEQIYYLGASIYGWWYWSRSEPSQGVILVVTRGSSSAMARWLLLTIIGSLMLGAVMARIHLWVPAWFSEAASYPYLDASTTMMSFVAMWLMARKHLESWLYWIVVDAIGIGLYLTKGVKLVAILYVVLLVLAVRGFVVWRRAMRSAGSHPASSP